MSVSQRTGSPIVISEPPTRLVVDTGPVIGAMYAADAHHATATRGFQQLIHGRTQLLIPAPILFEVYKRLAYDVGPDMAHQGLAYMQTSFLILHLGQPEIDLLQRTTLGMPWWGGSLEDATLAMVARRIHAPVWTFNYRDLDAFKDLEFWSPG